MGAPALPRKQRLKRRRPRSRAAAIAASGRRGGRPHGRGAGLLRDRFAGPHTPDMATAKAYTAASFRTNTTELAEASQPGRPASGIRNRPGVAAVGGGMMIEAGGSLLGAIGVPARPAAARTTRARLRGSPRSARRSNCHESALDKTWRDQASSSTRRVRGSPPRSRAHAQPVLCGARKPRAIRSR